MDAASGGDERMVFVRGLARSQRAPTAATRRSRSRIRAMRSWWPAPSPTSPRSPTLRRRGCIARRAVCVRIASHTRRLAAAVPPFRASLAAANVRRPLPGTRVFAGIDGGSVLDVDVGRDKLARQIAEPVEWAACLAACVEAGAARSSNSGRAARSPRWRRPRIRRCRRAASPIFARSTASSWLARVAGD
jgi:[acyl-carrier-protein] S-malonyltransferase